MQIKPLVTAIVGDFAFRNATFEGAVVEFDGLVVLGNGFAGARLAFNAGLGRAAEATVFEVAEAFGGEEVVAGLELEEDGLVPETPLETGTVLGAAVDLLL